GGDPGGGGGDRGRRGEGRGGERRRVERRAEAFVEGIGRGSDGACGADAAAAEQQDAAEEEIKGVRGAWSGAGADPTMLVMRTEEGSDRQIRRGRSVRRDRSRVRTAPRWGAAAMLALAAGLGQGGCSVSRAPLPPGVLATDAAASAAQELARLDAAQRQSGKASAELPAALDLPALHAPEPLPPGATVDLAGALEAVRGVV